MFNRWVLELLYPDLLDWANWLWEQRRIPPLWLSVAGSDPCIAPASKEVERGGGRAEAAAAQPPHHLWCKKSWGMGKLQGARFESLDNSPMYDPPDGYSIWNATTHRMNIYDVGQSAATAAEAEALGAIAAELNRPADAAMLAGRYKQLGELINTHMWQPELGVYSNLLLNGTAYPRIAPTSFYPLLAGLASDEQATATITSWLTNSTRFCVPASAADWPPAAPPNPNGNTSCYWGMPSIAADDPAYMVAGGTSGIYWRGATWPPQAYLVFLALQRYDHLPAARAARQGLVAQQLDLMLGVWRATHHICENYGSTSSSNASDCTGNHFYSWGGLSALMALTESNTTVLH